MNLQYMDSNSSIEELQSGDVATELVAINSIYTTALMGSPFVKNSTMDNWNNVKIPMIEYLQETANTDGDGWLAVDHNTTTVIFFAHRNIRCSTPSEYQQDLQSRDLLLGPPMSYC
jgi:hypothetical protein